MLENSLPGGKLARSRLFLQHHVHDFNLAAMILCFDASESKTQAFEQNLSDRYERLRPVVTSGG